MNFSHAKTLIEILRNVPEPREGLVPKFTMEVEQALAVATIVEDLINANESLKEHARSQRLELRRLNASHLVKNARVANLEKALAVELSDTEELEATVKAFLMGDIVVVKPFTQVPMPPDGGPDLMAMLRGLPGTLPPGKLDV